MLKIWSLKKQQDEEAKNGDSGPRKKKVTAAEIRVQKDLSDLSLPSTITTVFDNPEDIMNFKMILKPDEGMYKGGVFKFSFGVNANFPHEPPKVKCLQKIYHPNIDLEGNVCLNILREDWKPILNLDAVMIGIQYLFLEPNASDPLNKEAASSLQKNRENFKYEVKNSMQGRSVGGISFDNVLH